MGFKSIKRYINNLIMRFRRIFIKEKKDIVSSNVFDNISLNFKNISPYTELDNYKMVLLLLFSGIILLTMTYFSYIDFKSNIIKNNPVKSREAVQIIVKNPIDIETSDGYENIVYNVRRGDTLTSILLDKIKISKQSVFSAINELKKVYDLESLMTDQKLQIKYSNNLISNEDNVINNVILEELKITDDNNLKEIVVYKTEENSYETKVNKMELHTYYDKYVVKILNNIYTDGVSAGMPAEIVMDLINYYSFDIDFQRDLRKGDWFEVVFESSYTKDGKKVKNGEIVYANLHTSNSDHKIYRFEYKNSKLYFNENGLSTQKSLLKTPINGARISSGFSKGRKHPVLGYTRAHKGIDFAAPIGTPFYSAGNGTVKKVVTGCKVGDRYCGGGFGNYISIQHNSTYTTEYAHISNIAKNIRPGIKVKQGQVIAYVGETGLVTGPHLHYGILYKGERINPAKIKTVSLIKLVGNDLLEFVEERDRINTLRYTAINQNANLNRIYK